MFKNSAFRWTKKNYLAAGVWLCCCLFSSNLLFASAKVTSGEFRLSGLNTEYILGSFAVAAGDVATVKLSFTSDEPYNLNQDVNVRVFRSEVWKDYLDAPSCTDKVKHSRTNRPLKLERRGKKYETEIIQSVDSVRDGLTHYFYFVITDCSLEFYMHDDSVPNLKYTLEATVNGSHISADESHLKGLHTFTFLISGILAVGLALTIFMAMHEKATIHAAMFLVMTAAACDSMSSLFEIGHLVVYAKNGIGSYMLDCISAHFEAICDAFIVILLLSVASGWTLPSDVISVQHNASMVQKVLGGFQSPFAALRSCSPSAILAMAILTLHVVLAQWGRMYNDDFDSYHDLAHLPGKVLMFFRILLGICMIICCFQTKSRCPLSLHAFYLKLGAVGSFWFLSLPVMTWFVNHFVVYHNRHWAVGMWGGALQTSAIVMLTWLVTSHSTAYHKFSHLSNEKDDLTDSLAAVGSPTSAEEPPRTWTMGKAKVRLD